MTLLAKDAEAQPQPLSTVLQPVAFYVLVAILAASIATIWLIIVFMLFADSPASSPGFVRLLHFVAAMPLPEVAAGGVGFITAASILYAVRLGSRRGLQFWIAAVVITLLCIASVLADMVVNAEVDGLISHLDKDSANIVALCRDAIAETTTLAVSLLTAMFGFRHQPSWFRRAP